MGLIPISDGIEQINDMAIDIIINIEDSINAINELCDISEKEEIKDICMEYLGEISTDVKKIGNYLNNMKKSIKTIENLLQKIKRRQNYEYLCMLR